MGRTSKCHNIESFGSSGGARWVKKSDYERAHYLPTSLCHPPTRDEEEVFEESRCDAPKVRGAFEGSVDRRQGEKTRGSRDAHAG